MFSHVLPQLLGTLLFLSFTLSSLSSKAMGVVWLVMVVGGGYSAVEASRAVRLTTPFSWIRIWLGTTFLLLLLKTVPMLYWSDPWAERHGELRLLLGAMGIYAIVLGGWFKDRRWLANTANALTMSSLMGLLWVSVYGRDAVPTHPIPWAGGLAMISALLLALGLKSNFPAGSRRLWLVGGLLALLAVLSSRSRGAFGIVIWWVLVCGHHLWSQRIRPIEFPLPPSARSSHGRMWAIAVVLIAAVWALSYTPVLQRPTEALYEAVEQLKISNASPTLGSNSSVGSRIFMWQKGLSAIQASPWMGYGRDGRLKLLHAWADEANSTQIHQLGHVHNEYLNQLIDHGIWGLASQLCLVLGLVWICWALLRAREITAALALSGITFVHFTASFSNVNFAHNYYTASLSTLIGLCLLMPELKSPT